jgi:hypothetical protein
MMASIEAFCDGSVSPSVMEGVTSSRGSDLHVGRIAVLIPALDLGYVEKTTKGVLTQKGNPDPLPMEMLAVRRAREILIERGIEPHVIFSDNREVVNRQAVSYVWRKLNPAGILLERLMQRGGYLRQSAGKFRTRRTSPIHEEILRLFNTDKGQFLLSQSLVWKEIEMKLTRGQVHIPQVDRSC